MIEIITIKKLVLLRMNFTGKNIDDFVIKLQAVLEKPRSLILKKTEKSRGEF